MDTLIVLAGPTAVGKTDLSIVLAKELNAEILSADSMQIYRRMDIGTAKPSPKLQSEVKHHLIDLVNPDQNFSVADYQAEFYRIITDVLRRGKLPLMVGGTGLYIRACTQSYVFDPGGPNNELRNEFRKIAERHGVTTLHQRLAEVDPQAAIRIHPNDLVRIIRALEVFHTTGTPLSALQPKRHPDFQYKTTYIFLDRDRNELYHRIETRVDQMIEDGFIEEVQTLLQMGYDSSLKPMQSLGYRHINEYLQGKLSLAEALTQIKRETRHYAKRQLTWFRREPIDLWLNISERKQEFIGEILRYIEGRLD
ncbi:tRNA (adenosine(37)-N6)-dimethylallyltransferase MiaA [Hydrogenispora ethanolica]|jgi:tRNA dimethylallyltransferase|nr:tRNA (adenosine(37)-N6)-dimethylallyltransferase MiaA [Hydrogenispora ethanolica]